MDGTKERGRDKHFGIPLLNKGICRYSYNTISLPKKSSVQQIYSLQLQKNKKKERRIKIQNEVLSKEIKLGEIQAMLLLRV